MIGYVHFDLKQDNVLVSPTRHLAPAYFGLAVPVNDDGRVADTPSFGTRVPKCYFGGLFCTKKRFTLHSRPTSGAPR